MKIMVITQIYPGYKEETSQTSPFAVHYFTEYWSRMGHEVEVIRIWPYHSMPFSLIYNKRLNEYAYEGTFKLDNVTIHRIPTKKIPGLDFSKDEISQATLKAKEKINKFNPDLIISHSISPSFYIGCYLAHIYNLPFFLVIHNTDIKYLRKPANKRKFLRYHNQITGTFFRSPVLKRNYEKLFGEKANQNVIVTSGVEKIEINSLKEFKAKANEQSLNLLVVCNLRKIKRVDDIIRSISLLKDKNELHLKIIGDGPEKKNLEKLVNEKRLDKYVEFLGFLDRQEVLRHMELADIFVLVSSPETFGLVYIEAMAKACLVIGSKGEGIDGIIKNGKNGFLCEVGDIQELSKIINQCIKMKPDDKLEILKNTYKTVINLTHESCAEHYLDEMIELL